MYRVYSLLFVFLFSSCTLGSENVCSGPDDCLSGQICFRGFCNNRTGACAFGDTRPCSTGGRPALGECKAGIFKCLASGEWSKVCEGVVKPSPEVCDGKDNDCDGTIDGLGTGQPLRRSCYSGTPGTEKNKPCREGQQTCVNGQWTTCEKEVVPRKEICGNKVDDNCDGAVDNLPNIGKPCQIASARPECKSGRWECDSNELVVCKPPRQPEICNNKDDDCNGKVDEGCSCETGQTRSCGATQQGACRKGVQHCLNGKWSSECKGEIKPKAEVCNGVDDDCDGNIDNRPNSRELLYKECYTGPPGTKGRGTCRAGRQQCMNGKFSKTCTGQVVPVEERCGNQKDDNCDGVVDNVLHLGEACLDSSRKGRCRGGVLQCWGLQRVCLALAPFSSAPIPETCNGVDDNCDGYIDNAQKGKNTPLTKSCGTNVGLCKAGKRSCKVGRWSHTCVGEKAPVPEACNKKDDDCDGAVDEGGVCNSCQNMKQRSCYTGPIATRKVGRCRDGYERCTLGKWSGVCSKESLPTSESCNGIDDDCDGRVDNKPGMTQALTQSCYGGPSGTLGKGTCAAGFKVCKNKAWSACQFSFVPVAERCDHKDNDCDGKVDEGNVCFGSSRKLFEKCNRDKNALPFETCGKGLICLRTSPSSPLSFCYQSCKSSTTCAANKDVRKECLLVPEANSTVCLGRVPYDAPCDDQAGILCASGLLCDGVTHRCRYPGVAPPLGACSGETKQVCPKGYKCSFPTPGLPYGFCMMKCSATHPCHSGGFCFFQTKTEGVCFPVGTQKQDELCGNPNGDKIVLSNYCVKGQFCFRPSPTNPYGVCAPFVSNCQCSPGRLCLPAPNQQCLSLKSCGNCPSGQVCASYGSVGKACAPAAPTGSVSFGRACSLIHRCQSGLVCFTRPGGVVGHCTKVGCQSDTECPKTPSGSSCKVVTSKLEKACVFACQRNADCPSNFVCDTKMRFCFPQ